MNKKCRYVNRCTLYREDHDTCTKDEGFYYGPGLYGGCGRALAAKGKEAYCYKQPTQKMTKNNTTNLENVAIGIIILAMVLTGRLLYLLHLQYGI